MTIELIQSTSTFKALKEDWNLLLTSSASHVPFLRHEYLSSWWSTLGGGEWEGGDLAVLVERDASGTLTAAAPFFISGDRVMFLGSFEISDYLDFIAPPEKLSSFISGTLSALNSGDFPSWKVLDLYNLREESPSLPILKESARQAGYTVTEEVVSPAPYLQLPESWQTYLEGLKDRYAREITKKLVNAENYFLPVSWYIVEDRDALESELDSFLGLMANHPKKAQFLTSEMVGQLKKTSREGFHEGWLQLSFLRVGDIKAAGYLNFDFNNQLWIYNSGMDPLFENLSPGWVLLGKIIQWAIENGRAGLDFMRGDETYKYQFGGIDKKVLRLQISK